MSLKKIDLGVLSTPALHARLEKNVGESADFYRESCEILAELHSRGEKSPYFRIFPHYQEVAAGTLDPLLAMSNLTDRRKTSIAREKVPLETQRALAEAERIVIPVFSESNKIVKETRHIAALTDEQLMRAIRGGEIRSFEDQKADLRLYAPQRRRAVGQKLRIVAAPKTREIIVNDVRFKFNDPQMVQAYADLGYAIVKKDKAT